MNTWHRSGRAAASWRPARRWSMRCWPAAMRAPTRSPPPPWTRCARPWRWSTPADVPCAHDPAPDPLTYRVPMTHSAPTVTLAGGTELPAIGQGTWYMGDDPDRRGEEIAALRAGIEAGSTVVDTAEMYGGGRSESLVGEAIAPVRDQVFLVDKVLPMNASRRGTVEACERSLRALGTEHIDLYLLHWPGSHPLAETLDAFEELMDRDLIGAWGVSNFDPGDLGGLSSPPVVNQVLYNPSRRSEEHTSELQSRFEIVCRLLPHTENQRTHTAT